MAGIKKQLPQGWAQIELNEIMARTLSINPSKMPDVEYELWSVPAFPFNTPEYLRGEEIGSNKQMVKPGDVLLCKINPRINRVWIVREKNKAEQIASTEWIVLRCIEFFPKYIMYQLREENFRSMLCSDLSGVGGSLTRARPKIVGNLKIKIAPLKEQKRIVSKIEELQACSRKAREALETVPDLLEQLRQSILAAAFRGDLTRQWREQNPEAEPASELLKRIRIERRKRWEAAELDKLKAKGLTGDKLNAQFAKRRKQYKEPEPVDTTGLPELPCGWFWASWGEVGFCQNGRAFPSKHYSKEGTKLLRPGNLHVSGKIEWTEENTRNLPDEWAKQYPGYFIGPKELVINLTAQSLRDEFLGRVCLSGPDEHCLLNQRIARLTPVVLSTVFCFWLFKSMIFRRYVDTLNTGSLIQHMFTTQIYNFVFPLPPIEEQVELVKKVEELFQIKNNFEQSMLLLAGLPDSLEESILAKAFVGGLVPQDPNDEPASILLERIRQEKARLAAQKKTKPRQRGKKMKGPKIKQKDILTILQESASAMTPEELFAAGGFGEDSVDAFYEQLRAAVIAKKVRETRKGTDVRLEAMF